MADYREFSLRDTEWGDLHIRQVIPKGGDPWGFLSSLQGTIWGDQVSLVPKFVMEQALYGRTLPLVQKLGPEPEMLGYRIPEDFAKCRLHQEETCIIRNHHCITSSKKTPGCFVPLLGDLVDNPEVEFASSFLVRSWKEGYYVVVVISS